ncbi:MAG: hypothetical protein ACK2UO_06305, partial [Caldilineaceae bacterium]
VFHETGKKCKDRAVRDEMHIIQDKNQGIGMLAQAVQQQVAHRFDAWRRVLLNKLTHFVATIWQTLLDCSDQAYDKSDEVVVLFIDRQPTALIVMLC